MNTSTLNIKVACYCRLSCEDAKLGESVSIETQKKVLEDYCRNENLPVYDYYVDITVPRLIQYIRPKAFISRLSGVFCVMVFCLSGVMGAKDVKRVHC